MIRLIHIIIKSKYSIVFLFHFVRSLCFNAMGFFQFLFHFRFVIRIIRGFSNLSHRLRWHACIHAFRISHSADDDVNNHNDDDDRFSWALNMMGRELTFGA